MLSRHLLSGKKSVMIMSKRVLKETFNLPSLTLLGVILVSALAFGANYWFNASFNNPIPSPTPQPETDPPLVETASPITPSPIPTIITITPSPTPSPIPTPRPTSPSLPTQTPPPQNIQVTASFFEGVKICSQQNLPIINQIISNTESSLEPVEQTYQQCSKEARECQEDCIEEGADAVNISCVQTCEQKQQRCDQDYYQQKDPLVQDALNNLNEYCMNLR